MAAIKLPEPEQIREISENFSEYSSQLKDIQNRLTDAMYVMFPPYTGERPEREHLELAVRALQYSAQVLEEFSGSMKIALEYYKSMQEMQDMPRCFE